MRPNKKAERKKKEKRGGKRRKIPAVFCEIEQDKKIGGERNIIQEPLGYIAKSKKEIKSNK